MQTVIPYRRLFSKSKSTLNLISSNFSYFTFAHPSVYGYTVGTWQRGKPQSVKDLTASMPTLSTMHRSLCHSSVYSCSCIWLTHTVVHVNLKLLLNSFQNEPKYLLIESNHLNGIPYYSWLSHAVLYTTV